MSGADRVLLIGASGRVGQMVARAWPDHGACLTQTRSAEAAGRFDLVWDPLAGRLPDWPGGTVPGALVMLAGATGGAPDRLADNTRLAVAALRAAEAAGIPRVLLASSIAVYGPEQDGPLSEAADPAPANPYGHAKLAMEATADPFRAAGLEVCALRIGNVVGADQLFRNGAAAGPGAPLSIDTYPDGTTPVRSYLGPAWFARVLAVLAAAPGPLPPVLNLAQPPWLEMGALADAAGFAWQPKPVSADPKRQRLRMDLARLQALLPELTAPAGAETMVADLQSVHGGTP